jgi:hypothetical protein
MRLSREEFLRQCFQNALSEKHLWWHNGVQHLRAADLIFEKCWDAKEKWEEVEEGTFSSGTREHDFFVTSRLSDQVTLLVALGLENMLKGLWAVQHSEQIEASESLPTPISTHDLNEVVNEVDLETTPAEDSAIEILSEYIEWIGRYPIPTDLDEYVDERIDRNWIWQKYPGPVSFPDEVSILVEKISNRIEEAREE